MKKRKSAIEITRLVFTRADTQELAAFDESTKVCIMNCGPHMHDPRSAKERKFLCGDCLTKEEAHLLVDYVYGRPVGDPGQEVGGVMVTLAALCLAQRLNMHLEGETELNRIWTKVDQIRAKQAAKPRHSPLPGPSSAEGHSALAEEHY